MSSWLTHFTVVPTAIVSSFGVKVKLSIVISLASFFVASCAATVPNANIAPMTGPKSNATTKPRLRTNLAAATRSWLIKIGIQDPRSTGQRLVDDRERLVTLHHADGGQPQQGAELVGGDKHRARRRGATGSRLGKRRRQSGVEGHIAFDLLGQLVNVSVQNGD